MGQVSDSKKFIKTCRGRLSAVLQDPQIWEREEQLPRGSRYIFSSPKATKAAVEERTYSVLQFYTGWENYWLAVSIELGYDGGSFIASTSLVIFTGDANDDIKVPFLRAEWGPGDGAGIAISTNHAQPHWHVYRGDSASITMKTREPIGFEPVPKTDASVGEQDDREHFHFAMASGWHNDGRNSHISDFDEKSVEKWLDGCLSYIKGELTYLSSRRGV